MHFGVSHADQTVTTFSYDPTGNCTAVLTQTGPRHSPLTAKTEYHRDALGRICKIVSPSGSCVQLTYDPAGNVIRLDEGKDGNLRTTFLEYDAANRLVLQLNPDQSRTRFVHDAGNRLIERTVAYGTSEAATTSYEYDGLDRRTRMTTHSSSGASEVVTYGYDPSSNLTSLTNGRGKRWSFRHDLLERLIEATDPLGRVTGYRYEVEDRPGGKVEVVTRTLNGVPRVRTTYDLADRPARVEYFSAAGTPQETVTLGYDPFGNVLSCSSTNGTGIVRELDSMDRVLAETRAHLGKTTRLTYDLAGNRRTLSIDGMPAASRTYTWDPANRLTRIDGPGSATVGFEYDAHDRRSRATLGNGVTVDYGHDSAGRIERLTYKRSGSPFFTLSLTYDLRGNVRTRTRDDGTVRTDTFTYDNLDRLTAALYGDGTSEAWEHDANGNWTRVTSGAETRDFTVDEADQYVRVDGPGTASVSYQFTTAGEWSLSQVAGTTRPTLYGWNPVGQLVSVVAADSTQLSLDYEPAAVGGLRWRSTMAGGTLTQTRTLWDGDGSVLAELDPDNHVTRLYVNGTRLDEVFG
ncbi:MAG: RHS repeat protein, partial [candidate division NC10 bacterium]|nr:RHS repeat protein [candidate division NC10 bacterium]